MPPARTVQSGMEPTVVCAFDPDAGDRAPVELARLAARLLGSSLLIVVVRPGGTAPERLARVEERGARRPLEALAAELRWEPAAVRVVTAPSAASGLYDVLASVRPALAVAGSAEQAPHGRVRPGTTTQRLLDGAPCPVAIAPRGWTERPLRAIAVAVLPSPEGRAALRAGAALAHAACLPLRIVLVLAGSPDTAEANAIARELADDGPHPAIPGGLDHPARDRAPTAGGAAAVLVPALAGAAIAAEPAAPRLDVASEVYVGDPADTIVRASAQTDLLVLGSRAYGPAGEVHTGGVSRRVLDRAHCPVVLIPREAALA
jgi:nucleotide-binding universal stress UspA family protein